MIPTNPVMNKSNLIVVAHPDDEAIWFSSIIKKQNSVICICFQNKYPEHVEENLSYTSKIFEIIKEYRNYAPMIWLQTIKTTQPRIFGNIDIRTKNCLYTNIESIISIVAPERIYTHNPVGEYGHSEHVLVHNILAEHWKNLLSFPMYGMSTNLDESNISIAEQNDVDLDFRQELFSKYKKRDVWTGSKGEPYGDKELFLKYR